MYLKKVALAFFSICLWVAIPVGGLAYKHVALPAAITDPIGELIRSLPEVSSGRKAEAKCEDDLTWLACAIYFEARNQDYDGQYMVAQVVLNRVEDKRWPNTIEEVVRQGEEKRNQCQFSFMCDGKPERIENRQAWEMALAVAVDAMEDYYQDVIVTCSHSYHANYVTSPKALRWFASLQSDGEVGAHEFYCD